ncbi:MAG: hypothetical protein IJ728_01255 [Selenomonadaceae bacterium]|nr:hypothetical protein [Selenomonadaceae bacterium]
MADIERRVENVEIRVTSLEQQVSNVVTKMDMFIEESRAARERQDAEIREIRERQDAGMREMRSEINNLANSFRTMNITVIIGIAAMVVAILLK